MARVQPLEVLNTVVFRGKVIEEEGKRFADMAWFDSESGKILVSRHEIEDTTAEKLRGMV